MLRFLSVLACVAALPIKRVSGTPTSCNAADNTCNTVTGKTLTSVVEISAEEHLWLLRKRANENLRSRLVSLQEECERLQEEVRGSNEGSSTAKQRLQNLSTSIGVDLDFDSPCRAEVFEDDDFGGWSHQFEPGDHAQGSWPAPAKGNDISSMKVTGFCSVTLFQGAKFGGKWSATFSRGSYTLRDLEAGGAKNDRTNSIRVVALPKDEKWSELASSVHASISQLLQSLDRSSDEDTTQTIAHANTRGTSQNTFDEIDCTQHLSCEDCFDEGCGWCISDRICVPDKPWICLGEHDHVGKFSDRLVKKCPEAEEFTESITPKSIATPSNQKPAHGSHPDTSKLYVCVGWHRTSECDPNGKREPANDRSCAQIVPSGESGYCACGLRNEQPTKIIKTALSSCSMDREPWTCAAKCATLATEHDLEEKVRLEEVASLRESELQRLRGATAHNSQSAPIDSKCDEIEEFMAEMRNLQRNSEPIAQKNNQPNSEESAAKLGADFPYEALAVEFTAAPSTIRKAYRTRSLWLHPDKAPASCKHLASDAFSMIVAAYEILGNPDKREMFDDFGEAEQEQFFSRWEWEKYASSKTAKDFYTRDPFVTNLNEASWDRRVGGEDTSIWLVEFYAPWCKACQDFSPQYKELARELSGDEVEVGAVNCESQQKACRDWFAVPSYPTLRLINRHFGMQQDYKRPDPNRPLSAEGVADWVRSVAVEWRILFGISNVTELTPATFNEELFGNATSPEFQNSTWFVLFTDGTTCGPCRTAKTNLMRLGASSAGLSVRVAFVDCQKHRRFCRDEHGAPKAPHSPFIKIWPRSVAQRKLNRPGTLLYNANSIESHLAIEIAAKVIKHMATDQQIEEIVSKGHLSVNGDDGGVSNFEGDDSKDNPEDRGPPPFGGDFNWNGPTSRRASKKVGHGGGHARRRMISG